MTSSTSNVGCPPFPGEMFKDLREKVLSMFNQQLRKKFPSSF